MHDKKILIVDDDKLVGRMLTAMLMSRAIGAVVATSGHEALEILKKLKPNAIILI